MAIFSFFRPKTDLADVAIETIYAGEAVMREKLVLQDGLTVCQCCKNRVSEPTDPSLHEEICKIGRWYRAVEALSKAVSNA